MSALAQVAGRGVALVPAFLRDLVGVVLEDACVACEAPLAGVVGPTCDACTGRLASTLAAQRCRSCSSLASFDGSCVPCSATSRRLVVHAPREHAGVARDLVIALKARRRVDVAEILVQATLADARVLDALRGADLVVPVPGDPVRRRQRGVDHASLLASELVRQGRELGATARALDALSFRRAGERQAAAGARSRRQRQGGRLRMRWLRGPLVKGRRVVILDDVVTTGATAREAAMVLLRVGAAAVEVIACTRAQGVLVDLPSSRVTP